MLSRYERRLTAVFEVNEQFRKVPDAPDPEMETAPPYKGTTTMPHTQKHATVRSIFSQIDLQRNHSRAPHDLLPANYTRNRDNATQTQ